MDKSLCPYFGKCGGCNNAASAEDQLKEKQQHLVEEFSKLSPSTVIENPVSGPSEHYRSRARFRYSKQGLSFYEEHSNTPIIIRECPVLDQQLNDFLKNPPKLNLWELKDAELSCISTDKGVVYKDQMGWVTVNDKKLPVAGDVFFQSNRLLLPQLIDYVVSHVAGKYVMDLYAGVGTFSAFLEDKYTVTAVEINKRCLSLAKQHLKNTNFFASPVEKWNPKKQHVDTVIVDPPRVGLDKTVPSLIASFNPSTVIYVSCYLPTMLRDLKQFQSLGYTIRTAKLFDFYPHTSHVETVVLMSKAL